MQKAYSHDGTSIAFEAYGSGTPIILVGGALSDRSGAAPLAAVLAEHFTAYAFDRRGRGDSGDTAPYAVEREIEDIAALIDRAGGAAFVFGHSSGAVLALAAANALPQRIKRLALYEPPLLVNTERPPVPPDYVVHLQALLAAGRRSDAVEYFLTQAVRMPAPMMAGMRDTPMWSAMERLAHTIPYDGQVMGDTMLGKPLPPNRWPAVTMPTLVVVGGPRPNEEYFHQAAQALVANLPQAQLRVLPGQGHGAAPEVLAPLLIDFFALQNG